MKKLLLLFFISTVGFSQTIYRGNVSENGMPIPGVNVCVINTSRCTVTDWDGNYAIEVKIGDQLKLTYIGMKTKIIRVSSESVLGDDGSVKPIVSNDYVNKLKKPGDSVVATKSSGNYDFDLNETVENSTVMKISRDNYGFYSVKKRSQYHKMSFEMSHDFTLSTPTRLPKYQNRYAQGRSINQQLTYQSPETNEIFSWGPDVTLLEYSGNTSEYYPQGNIVNKGFGNGKSVQLYNSNDFFQHTEDNKWSLSTQIEGPKGNFLKMNFGYKTGNISIPSSRNNEITASAKYFRKFSEYSKIDALLMYNDFENNLSNANFGVNKIIFANAITPIHFDNHFAATLSNGLQRSYSVYENNPYYLIAHNLDKNKSKTLSFNLNHNYLVGKKSNIVNASFQTSEIRNTNGQDFYFAGNNSPNFNERIENFKSFSVSDVYKYTFDYLKYIESKIDFRFQQRDLQRNYLSNFALPSDVPDNAATQNKLDVAQNRFEVLYHLNGAYYFHNIFNTYSNLTLKLNSNLNYSSTVKDDFLFSYLGAVEVRRIFDRQLSFSLSHGITQSEPSLQNNNLNFNSLQYQISQFKDLKNNLELITPKNALATREAITNFSLLYAITYNCNLSFNYYNKNVHNLYTPVFNNGIANWSPDVNYKQNGVEFEFEKLNYNTRYFSYGFNVNFTYYKNEVTSLNNNQTRIPFAGFADVSKNYIVGQPLGVIVGNGYLRDSNQNIVIDNDGFPVVDSQPKILGNPNPDFVVGFFNSFRYKNFHLNLSFDWSKGGEIWNGTQQTLQYYGKSAQTADQRNTTNFVFNGVTASGAVNTKQVSFYDQNLPVEQNRWVRYGVSGIAEDAIEDASYFRLNAINLGYTSDLEIFNDKLSFTIAVFINNAFIVAKSKSAFSSNSMFNSVDTSGLDYFNSPLMKSFGTTLTIKF